MAKVEPVKCPRCGDPVAIYQSYGGRGCGDLTTYAAECEGCGLRKDHLGDNGRKDNATRAYNRWAAEETARLAGQPALAPRRPKPIVAPPRALVRSEFARGYFRAVANALRHEGRLSDVVRILFEQGEMHEQADPDDIALFRQHGLTAESLPAIANRGHREAAPV